MLLCPAPTVWPSSPAVAERPPVLIMEPVPRAAVANKGQVYTPLPHPGYAPTVTYKPLVPVMPVPKQYYFGRGIVATVEARQAPGIALFEQRLVAAELDPPLLVVADHKHDHRLLAVGEAVEGRGADQKRAVLLLSVVVNTVSNLVEVPLSAIRFN